MKTFLQKNNWWAYFILTYLISWPVWIAGKALLPDNLINVTLIMGAFGPFTAALIMLRITGDVPGLKNWLRTIFSFKVNFMWYLAGGIIMPFLFAAVHHAIYLLLGGKSGLEFSAEWLSYFAYLVSTTLLTGGNEEPGWRGYVTPVIMQRFSPLIACTITGIGWAAWHLPMYFLIGWGGNDQPFVWLLIYCIPLSMILTWLFYKSKESIIPVMLLHAGTNVVFNYFPMQTEVFESVSDEFTVIKTIVYWLFALILIVSTKGTLGFRK